MENPTKALLGILAAGILACKSKSAEPNIDISPRDSVYHSPSPNTTSEPEKYPLGNFLYRDSTGRVFLKVRNPNIGSPNLDDKALPESVYLSRVYSIVDSDNIQLKDIVDTLTFRRLNPRGSYFADSNHIYVRSFFPQFIQFFTLPRKGAVFLGENKEYLVAGGNLYWNGLQVEGLDTKSLSVLRVKRVIGTGFEEFITDGKRIFIGNHPLDSSRLRFVEGISARDRHRLERLSKNQPPPLEESKSRLDGAQ